MRTRRSDAKDLTGQRFGRLVVVRETLGIWYGDRPVLNRRWEVVCDCGNATATRQDVLLRGRVLSCGCLRAELTAQMGRRRGEDSPRWSGDAVSYGGMHDRVRYNRGKAQEHTCSRCDSSAQHWAYRWDLRCPDERLGVARQGEPLRPYCTHMDHYEPMCVSCHNDFDHNDERRVA